MGVLCRFTDRYYSFDRTGEDLELTLQLIRAKHSAERKERELKIEKEKRIEAALDIILGINKEEERRRIKIQLK